MPNHLAHARHDTEAAVRLEVARLLDREVAALMRRHGVSQRLVLDALANESDLLRDFGHLPPEERQPAARARADADLAAIRDTDPADRRRVMLDRHFGRRAA